jgi:hypothetical protein
MIMIVHIFSSLKSAFPERIKTNFEGRIHAFGNAMFPYHMEWFCHASCLPSQQNIDSILMPGADRLNTSLSTACHCQDFQGSATEMYLISNTVLPFIV